jgi:DNA-binding MarR family transcriptional regulator
VVPVRHPTSDLDETVHQRVRLGILAVAVEVAEVDFAYLKRALDLTDGNLSKHLQVLEKAGLVEIRKGYEGKRPRTWVSATGAGREALDTELAALKALVAKLDGVKRDGAPP